MLYVDSVDQFDYNFLPTYKKCDNGKYLQLCITELSEDLLKENADPIDLVFALDGFAQPAFNALSKKMNINFIKDKENEEEKKLVIKKFQTINRR